MAVSTPHDAGRPPNFCGKPKPFGPQRAVPLERPPWSSQAAGSRGDLLSLLAVGPRGETPRAEFEAFITGVGRLIFGQEGADPALIAASWPAAGSDQWLSEGQAQAAVEAITGAVAVDPSDAPRVLDLLAANLVRRAPVGAAAEAEAGSPRDGARATSAQRSLLRPLAVDVKAGVPAGSLGMSSESTPRADQGIPDGVGIDDDTQALSDEPPRAGPRVSQVRAAPSRAQAVLSAPRRSSLTTGAGKSRAREARQASKLAASGVLGAALSSSLGHAASRDFLASPTPSSGSAGSRQAPGASPRSLAPSPKIHEVGFGFRKQEREQGRAREALPMRTRDGSRLPPLITPMAVPRRPGDTAAAQATPTDTSGVEADDAMEAIGVAGSGSAVALRTASRAAVTMAAVISFSRALPAASNGSARDLTDGQPSPPLEPQPVRAVSPSVAGALGVPGAAAGSLGDCRWATEAEVSSAREALVSAVLAAVQAGMGPVRERPAAGAAFTAGEAEAGALARRRGAGALVVAPGPVADGGSAMAADGAGVGVHPYEPAAGAAFASALVRRHGPAAGRAALGIDGLSGADERSAAEALASALDSGLVSCLGALAACPLSTQAAPGTPAARAGGVPATPAGPGVSGDLATALADRRDAVRTAIGRSDGGDSGDGSTASRGDASPEASGSEPDVASGPGLAVVVDPAAHGGAAAAVLPALRRLVGEACGGTPGLASAAAASAVPAPAARGPEIADSVLMTMRADADASAERLAAAMLAGDAPRTPVEADAALREQPLRAWVVPAVASAELGGAAVPVPAVGRSALEAATRSAGVAAALARSAGARLLRPAELVASAVAASVDEWRSRRERWLARTHSSACEAEAARAEAAARVAGARVAVRRTTSEAGAARRAAEKAASKRSARAATVARTAKEAEAADAAAASAEAALADAEVRAGEVEASPAAQTPASWPSPCPGGGRARDAGTRWLDDAGELRDGVPQTAGESLAAVLLRGGAVPAAEAAPLLAAAAVEAVEEGSGYVIEGWSCDASGGGEAGPGEGWAFRVAVTELLARGQAGRDSAAAVRTPIVGAWRLQPDGALRWADQEEGRARDDGADDVADGAAGSRAEDDGAWPEARTFSRLDIDRSRLGGAPSSLGRRCWWHVVPTAVAALVAQDEDVRGPWGLGGQLLDPVTGRRWLAPEVDEARGRGLLRGPSARTAAEFGHRSWCLEHGGRDVGRAAATAVGRGSRRAGQGEAVPLLASAWGDSLGMEGGAAGAAASAVVPLLQPFAGPGALWRHAAARSADGSRGGVSVLDDALASLGGPSWRKEDEEEEEEQAEGERGVPDDWVAMVLRRAAAAAEAASRPGGDDDAGEEDEDEDEERGTPAAAAAGSDEAARRGAAAVVRTVLRALSGASAELTAAAVRAAGGAAALDHASARLGSLADAAASGRAGSLEVHACALADAALAVGPGAVLRSVRAHLVASAALLREGTAGALLLPSALVRVPAVDGGACLVDLPDVLATVPRSCLARATGTMTTTGRDHPAFAEAPGLASTAGGVPAEVWRHAAAAADWPTSASALALRAMQASAAALTEHPAGPGATARGMQRCGAAGAGGDGAASRMQSLRGASDGGAAEAAAGGAAAAGDAPPAPRLPAAARASGTRASGAALAPLAWLRAAAVDARLSASATVVELAARLDLTLPGQAVPAGPVSLGLGSDGAEAALLGPGSGGMAAAVRFASGGPSGARPLCLPPSLVTDAAAMLPAPRSRVLRLLAAKEEDEPGAGQEEDDEAEQRLLAASRRARGIADDGDDDAEAATSADAAAADAASGLKGYAPRLDKDVTEAEPLPSVLARSRPGSWGAVASPAGVVPWLGDAARSALEGGLPPFGGAVAGSGPARAAQELTSELAATRFLLLAGEGALGDAAVAAGEGASGRIAAIAAAFAVQAAARTAGGGAGTGVEAGGDDGDDDEAAKEEAGLAALEAIGRALRAARACAAAGWADALSRGPVRAAVCRLAREAASLTPAGCPELESLVSVLGADDGGAALAVSLAAARWMPSGSPLERDRAERWAAAPVTAALRAAASGVPRPAAHRHADRSPPFKAVLAIAARPGALPAVLPPAPLPGADADDYGPFPPPVMPLGAGAAEPSWAAALRPFRVDADSAWAVTVGEASVVDGRLVTPSALGSCLLEMAESAAAAAAAGIAGSPTDGDDEADDNDDDDDAAASGTGGAARDAGVRSALPGGLGVAAVAAAPPAEASGGASGVARFLASDTVGSSLCVARLVASAASPWQDGGLPAAAALGRVVATAAAACEAAAAAAAALARPKPRGSKAKQREEALEAGRRDAVAAGASAALCLGGDGPLLVLLGSALGSARVCSGLAAAAVAAGTAAGAGAGMTDGWLDADSSFPPRARTYAAAVAAAGLCGPALPQDPWASGEAAARIAGGVTGQQPSLAGRLGAGYLLIRAAPLGAEARAALEEAGVPPRARGPGLEWCWAGLSGGEEDDGADAEDGDEEDATFWPSAVALSDADAAVRAGVASALTDCLSLVSRQGREAALRLAAAHRVPGRVHTGVDAAEGLGGAGPVRAADDWGRSLPPFVEAVAGTGRAGRARRRRAKEAASWLCRRHWTEFGRFCPVALAETGRLVHGSPRLAAEWRGGVVVCSSLGRLAAFLRRPARFMAQDRSSTPASARLAFCGPAGAAAASLGKAAIEAMRRAVTEGERRAAEAKDLASGAVHGLDARRRAARAAAAAAEAWPVLDALDAVAGAVAEASGAAGTDASAGMSEASGIVVKALRGRGVVPSGAAAVLLASCLASRVGDALAGAAARSAVEGLGARSEEARSRREARAAEDEAAAAKSAELRERRGAKRARAALERDQARVEVLCAARGMEARRAERALRLVREAEEAADGPVWGLPCGERAGDDTAGWALTGVPATVDAWRAALEAGVVPDRVVILDPTIGVGEARGHEAPALRPHERSWRAWARAGRFDRRFRVGGASGAGGGADDADAWWSLAAAAASPDTDGLEAGADDADLGVGGDVASLSQGWDLRGLAPSAGDADPWQWRSRVSVGDPLARRELGQEWPWSGGAGGVPGAEGAWPRRLPASRGSMEGSSGWPALEDEAASRAGEDDAAAADPYARWAEADEDGDGVDEAGQGGVVSSLTRAFGAVVGGALAGDAGLVGSGLVPSGPSALPRDAEAWGRAEDDEDDGAEGAVQRLAARRQAVAEHRAGVRSAELADGPGVALAGELALRGHLHRLAGGEGRAAPLEAALRLWRSEVQRLERFLGRYGVDVVRVPCGVGVAPGDAVLAAAAAADPLGAGAARLTAESSLLLPGSPADQLLRPCHGGDIVAGALAAQRGREDAGAAAAAPPTQAGVDGAALGFAAEAHVALTAGEAGGTQTALEEAEAAVRRQVGEAAFALAAAAAGEDGEESDGEDELDADGPGAALGDDEDDEDEGAAGAEDREGRMQHEAGRAAAGREEARLGLRLAVSAARACAAAGVVSLGVGDGRAAVPADTEAESAEEAWAGADDGDALRAVAEELVSAAGDAVAELNEAIDEAAARGEALAALQADEDEGGPGRLLADSADAAFPPREGQELAAGAADEVTDAGAAEDASDWARGMDVADPEAVAGPAAGLLSLLPEAPVSGSHCPVALVEEGVRVPGSSRHAVVVGGAVYRCAGPAAAAKMAMCSARYVWGLRGAAARSAEPGAVPSADHPTCRWWAAAQGSGAASLAPVPGAGLPPPRVLVASQDLGHETAAVEASVARAAGAAGLGLLSVRGCLRRSSPAWARSERLDSCLRAALERAARDARRDTAVAAGARAAVRAMAEEAEPEDDENGATARASDDGPTGRLRQAFSRAAGAAAASAALAGRLAAAQALLLRGQRASVSLADLGGADGPASDEDGAEHDAVTAPAVSWTSSWHPEPASLREALRLGFGEHPSGCVVTDLPRPLDASLALELVRLRVPPSGVVVLRGARGPAAVAAAWAAAASGSAPAHQRKRLRRRAEPEARLAAAAASRQSARAINALAALGVPVSTVRCGGTATAWSEAAASLTEALGGAGRSHASPEAAVLPPSLAMRLLRTGRLRPSAWGRACPVAGRTSAGDDALVVAVGRTAFMVSGAVAARRFAADPWAFLGAASSREAAAAGGSVGDAAGRAASALAAVVIAPPACGGTAAAARAARGAAGATGLATVLSDAQSLEWLARSPAVRPCAARDGARRALGLAFGSAPAPSGATGSLLAAALTLRLGGVFGRSPAGLRSPGAVRHALAAPGPAFVSAAVQVSAGDVGALLAALTTLRPAAVLLVRASDGEALRLSAEQAAAEAAMQARPGPVVPGPRPMGVFRAAVPQWALARAAGQDFAESGGADPDEADGEDEDAACQSDGRWALPAFTPRGGLVIAALAAGGQVSAAADAPSDAAVAAAFREAAATRLDTAPRARMGPPAATAERDAAAAAAASASEGEDEAAGSADDDAGAGPSDEERSAKLAGALSHWLLDAGMSGVGVAQAEAAAAVAMLPWYDAAMGDAAAEAWDGRRGWAGLHAVGESAPAAAWSAGDGAVVAGLGTWDGRAAADAGTDADVAEAAVPGPEDGDVLYAGACVRQLPWGADGAWLGPRAGGLAAPVGAVAVTSVYRSAAWGVAGRAFDEGAGEAGASTALRLPAAAAADDDNDDDDDGSGGPSLPRSQRPRGAETRMPGAAPMAGPAQPGAGWVSMHGDAGWVSDPGSAALASGAAPPAGVAIARALTARDDAASAAGAAPAPGLHAAPLGLPLGLGSAPPRCLRDGVPLALSGAWPRSPALSGALYETLLASFRVEEAAATAAASAAGGLVIVGPRGASLRRGLGSPSAGEAAAAAGRAILAAAVAAAAGTAAWAPGLPISRRDVALLASPALLAACPVAWQDGRVIRSAAGGVPGGSADVTPPPAGSPLAPQPAAASTSPGLAARLAAAAAAAATAGTAGLVLFRGRLYFAGSADAARRLAAAPTTFLSGPAARLPSVLPSRLPSPAPAAELVSTAAGIRTPAGGLVGDVTAASARRVIALAGLCPVSARDAWSAASGSHGWTASARHGSRGLAVACGRDSAGRGLVWLCSSGDALARFLAEPWSFTSHPAVIAGPPAHVPVDPRRVPTLSSAPPAPLADRPASVAGAVEATTGVALRAALDAFAGVRDVLRHPSLDVRGSALAFVSLHLRAHNAHLRPAERARARRRLETFVTECRAARELASPGKAAASPGLTTSTARPRRPVAPDAAHAEGPRGKHRARLAARSLSLSSDAAAATTAQDESKSDDDATPRRPAQPAGPAGRPPGGGAAARRPGAGRRLVEAPPRRFDALASRAPGQTAEWLRHG